MNRGADRLGARGGLAVALFTATALVAVPAVASALSVLRLYLNGNVESVGRGGGEVFRDLDHEAFELKRPAQLAAETQGRLVLSLSNEKILSIDAARWAGTRADDQQFRLALLAPTAELLPELRVAVFAELKRETGYTHLERDGIALLHFEELRNLATLGGSVQGPFGLSAGAAFEQGEHGVPGYVAELRYQPIPELAVWGRKQSAVYSYRLAVPQGVARRLASPALLYEIDDTREAQELGAELRAGAHAWVRGGVLANEPRDHWVEVGGRPLSFLVLRAGLDAERFRFDDFMRAEGTGTIANVDLGVKRDRRYAGIDVDLENGRDRLEARYIHSRITAATRAEEVGTAAVRTFLDVDLDLGLLFESGYQLEGHQVTAGWSREVTERFGFSLGGQFMRLVSHPADYALTSDTLARSLAAEESRPTAVDILGLTGSAHYTVGSLRFRAALGQFIPVATHDDGADDGGTSGTGGKSEPSRPRHDDGAFDPMMRGIRSVLDKLQKYGGGNLVLLEVSTTF